MFSRHGLFGRLLGGVAAAFASRYPDLRWNKEAAPPPREPAPVYEPGTIHYLEPDEVERMLVTDREHLRQVARECLTPRRELRFTMPKGRLPLELGASYSIDMQGQACAPGSPGSVFVGFVQRIDEREGMVTVTLVEPSPLLCRSPIARYE